MVRTLIQLLKTGNVTQAKPYPDLPAYSRGLPGVTGDPCQATGGCRACADLCPSAAIRVSADPDGGRVDLDLGRCLACGLCTDACPSGTLAVDRSTTVAAVQREALVLSNRLNAAVAPKPAGPVVMLRRSIHLREVAAGDSGADMEIANLNNPIFDGSRFGIHFVASPRFADGLLVTGPVPRAMQEPLRRCYDAMATPRVVIAAGAAAISGGLLADGYAGADGVDRILPVDAYIPGNPPHPWYVIHGIQLAMGAVEPRGASTPK